MLMLAMPALMVSSVTLPLPARRAMLPSRLLVTTVCAPDCVMVMARPASRSMVLPLPWLVMSAFCSRSRAAFRLKWPLVNTTSALTVMSDVAPPAASSALPLLTLMPCVPVSASPSLTKIEPAAVCSTKLPVTITSDWSASVLPATTLDKPSAVTRLASTACVWPTSIALASSRYRPLPSTLALMVATSVSKWLALVPTAVLAFRRSALA